ncbi:MAG: hypothetical protein PG981_000952 [Wolbachia endosymbiont of Ctenocephalides orientis wCori]|nr:MAG: hypothetical protein PG981_000952 [Wolbachia endosymbiont of Ctenocephalides orientis wCori]
MKLKILDKIFRTGKRDVEKKQEVIDKSKLTEIRTYLNKSKELLKTAEIIGIEHDAGKYSIKSIGGLKQQIINLQSAGEELQHSLKELTNLPHRMTELHNEQIGCTKEINRLKQENHTLNKIKKSGTIKKSTIDEQRAINNGAITDLKKAIEENNTEIKDFHSGNKAETLKDNVKKNLRNFKKKVATLECKIRSIEEGPAPKPLIQTLRSAPLSPTEIRDNFQELARFFNDHGTYDTGKQYLREKLDLLNKFGIIKDENLQKMQNSINKPTITGQELIEIINTATESIDRDLKSRMEKPVIGNSTQTFADRFAGRVEKMEGNNKKDQTFADRVKESTNGNKQETQTFAGRVEESTNGSKQETQTFADKVQERTKEENKQETYRL